ncbi:jg21977, partial [Pararge aegeria aegeria]
MSAKVNSRLRWAVIFAIIAISSYSVGSPDWSWFSALPARAENNFTAVAARHGYRSEQHTVAT